MERLQVDLELGRGVERPREQPCGRRGYSSLAAHDFVDALQRDAEVVSECDLRDAKRHEELFEEHFAWVSRDSASREHGVRTGQW